jgi:hypothetical protein
LSGRRELGQQNALTQQGRCTNEESRLGNSPAWLDGALK